MLAVELTGASLPNPELKKNFKFRGAPRGIIPAGQNIPQFIGVEHDSEGLRIAEQFVEALPKHVKVGLEFDLWQLLDKGPRDLLVKASQSFSAIAATAERVGHRVVFIERRSFHVSPSDTNLVTLMRHIGEEALLHHESLDKLTEIAKRLNELSYHFGAGCGCSLFDVTRSSAWRSELMARSIARIGDWTHADVVLVGTAHAYNLARIFDTSITTVIGHYTSQDHLESRLSAVMRRQVASHTTLQNRRTLHKSLFTITNPLQAWRNRQTSDTRPLKEST